MLQVATSRYHHGSIATSRSLLRWLSPRARCRTRATCDFTPSIQLLQSDVPLCERCRGLRRHLDYRYRRHGEVADLPPIHDLVDVMLTSTRTNPFAQNGTNGEDEAAIAELLLYWKVCKKSSSFKEFELGTAFDVSGRPSRSESDARPVAYEHCSLALKVGVSRGQCTPRKAKGCRVCELDRVPSVWRRWHGPH